MTVAVVGGGISGLTLAHALRARGRDVVLLEASERFGGNIRSSDHQGFLTEDGPNGFLDREPATRQLLEALGLTGKLKPAAPAARDRFIFTRGALRALPSAPPRFLGSDVLPLGARLRVLAELFTRRRSTTGDESLADFSRRHFGVKATEVLMDAVQTGIYAGDPEQLSVGAAFPLLEELEGSDRSVLLGMMRREKQRRRESRTTPAAARLTGALCSLEGGMATLPRALADSLGAAAHPGAVVQRINRTPEGWRLSLFEDGMRATLDVKQLVLAVPAPAAAALLSPLLPLLGQDLAALEYAPMAVVHLAYRSEDLARPLTGFGFLVPGNEWRRLLGVFYVSSIFPWRAPPGCALFTCMLGGVRQKELLHQQDAELLELARTELGHALGLSAAPLFSRLVRWPHAIPQYNLGHRDRLSRIDAALRELPNLHLLGNAYRGVGINDCVRNAISLAGRMGH